MPGMRFFYCRYSPLAILFYFWLVMTNNVRTRTSRDFPIFISVYTSTKENNPDHQLNSDVNMLETIGVFVAKSQASYGFNKGLAKVFKDQKSFVNRLAQVINKTIDQYKQESPIVDKDGKFAFYDSQILLEELLKFRFFSKDGYRLSDDIITEALRDNPKIIPPGKKQLERFLEIFEQNIEADEELKKLEIDENYKAEIFSISDRIDQILEKLTGVKPFPKELTVLHRINKRDIIGRKNDLERLRTSLLENKETALINGMGGIGKTTLAGVYVDEFYKHYDHICWLTLETTVDEAVIANRELITNLGLAGVPAEQFFTACFSKLRNLECKNHNLLVLDNAFETLAQKYDYLPKAPNWHVLVTSREQVPCFKLLELDFLSEAEAIALFKKHNQKFTDDKIKQIVSAVELHTLTIEILACSSKENRWSFRQTMAVVKKDVKALVAVHHSGNKKIERVKTYLANIFTLNKLNEKQIWIITHFLVFPNAWMEYDFIVQLLQPEKLEWADEFAHTLETVYQKGFLLKDEQKDAYKMHSMLNEALQQNLNIDFENINDYIESITSLLRLDQTKDNPIDKFQYIPFGDSILKQLPDGGSEKISTLQNELGLICRNLGDYNKARDLLEAALKSGLANFGEKHPTVAVRQSNLANVYLDLGEYEKARDLLEAAFKSDLANFGEKHPNVARCQWNLANVYLKTGYKKEARLLWESAYKILLNAFGVGHPHTKIVKEFLDDIN